ncbi:MAG: GDP-L-fucose synthase [Rhodospirillaceae bacterium]|nr:GDP-L-fucose synthase [Rhodospirillaceae bacterium]
MIPSDPSLSLVGKRIWVAGHRGMVGSALVRRLTIENCEILSADRRQLDLREQQPVRDWIGDMQPDVVILAAARVGGIAANDTHPVDFLSDNLQIQTNVIDAAAQSGIKRLLFLGSSCIYPRLAGQPIVEDALLTGPLEPTNQWYAIAKIAGIKLCQAWRRQAGKSFVSAMPTNLYGPGDLFDEQASHVIPALIQRLHVAKETKIPVTIWGSGNPRREFLHVDDLADALVFLLKHYDADEHINVGVGKDIAIAELARLIGEIIGYSGDYVFDQSKPDGAPRKLMEISRLTSLGWTSSTNLRDGLEGTYQWFLDNIAGTAMRRAAPNGFGHDG